MRKVRFNYQIRAHTLLRQLVFIPMLVLIMMMFALHALSSFNELRNQKSERAQLLAELIATSVGEEIMLQHATANPVFVQHLENRITRLIKTQHIESVRFIAIRRDLRDSQAMAQQQKRHQPDVLLNDNQFNLKLQRYAPVILTRTPKVLNQNQTILLGYIQVTLDLTQDYLNINQILGLKFFGSSILVLLYWFLLRRLTDQWTKPIKRLALMLEQVRLGQTVNSRNGPPVGMSVAELDEMEFQIGELAAQHQDLRKQALEYEQKEALLMSKAELGQYQQDNFQALMSHELKTPLNAIWGGVQLLHAESNLTVQQQDSVSMIERGSKNLQMLINQVLDLMRLDQGNVKFEPVTFSLDTLLNQLVDDYRERAKQQNLSFNVYIKHAVVPVHADLNKIRRILNYILDNAFKFTEKGGVEVHGWLDEQAREGAVWHCEIRDTGIGVPPEFLNDIFKPFFQADSGQTRKFEGAGMGLTLAKRLTSLLNGSLELTSMVGNGTVVALRIPVQIMHQVQTVQSLQGMQVIVFESGLAARFADALRDFGMDVKQLVSSDQVLLTIKRQPIHVIFIDAFVAQPVWQAMVQYVRQQQELHITIILQVDVLDAWRERGYYALGIDHCLRWPVSRESLLQKIQPWLL